MSWLCTGGAQTDRFVDDPPEPLVYGCWAEPKMFSLFWLFLSLVVKSCDVAYLSLNRQVSLIIYDTESLHAAQASPDPSDLLPSSPKCQDCK